ncbi:lipocalin family protein [Sphingobacterium sp. SRCM116780]|uniref:lipocalin family protein n=1 Tax=Sphingobacterium sp. SRCM116780 TaxID=2907623 RepID=UPI001F475B08|nr:lipocalin family protein [Sphingobacterium sp. SRCM116780]UIR55414.1 lipocalin family protein [Sphingobacterium sp. SRCM116780]
MNRVLLSISTIMLGLFLFSGCSMQQKGATTSSSSSSMSTGPSASDWKGSVKGTWRLNSIDRENLPSTYTIKTVFEEAPAECFIGSTWVLPSNGKGTISFSADGKLCAPGASRDIVWSIYNPGKNNGEPQFQFKKIYAGDKAKNVTTGYRLDLSYSDANKLVMRMPVTISNGEAYLVFTFARVN